MPQPSWIAAPWPVPKNIIAGTTTRYGGVSQAPYDSFNLADHCGDHPDHVRKNRQILQDKLQLPSEPCWLEQIHSNTVINLDAKQTFPIQADAAFSASKGVVCAVLTADCLPILLCHQAGTSIAAIHAGWRGLCCGIIPNTIAALSEAPANYLAWLGPAISQAAYQVGQDVYDAFTLIDPIYQEAFIGDGDSHYRFDMYKVATQQLHKSGITAIYGGEFCTYQQAMFYSYRRDKQTGRMATLIFQQEAC